MLCLFDFFIDEGTNTYVPKVKVNQRKKCVWMNKKVKKLLNKKDRLFKLTKTNRTEKNVNDLKKVERQCRNAVRNAKKAYEKKLANNGNFKPFNAYIKSKTKNRSAVGPLKIGNEVISDFKAISENLNTYFASVYTREDLTNVPICPTFEGRKLTNVTFTRKKILDKIKKLKPMSAPGPDKITPRMLKEHKESLSTALSIIFENSFQTGVVPPDWKIAHVTAIHKKGTKGSVENYRPVSLTSIPCKLMESIIKDDIIDHLLTNELLKSSQHGFMRNKSTVTNLLEFFEKITSIVDNGDPADIVYLDFSKAFDKVPHRRLLNKIQSYGIENKVIDWIEKWLTGRYQRTVLNGMFSSWESVLSGIPQGSVLGPLAFIIFIDDIDATALLIDILNKFADDAKIGKKVRSEDDNKELQDCLDKLMEWAEKWGMKFNVEKCSVIHIGGKKNKEFEYKMNNVPLKKSTLERDLGVLISADLKPTEQCMNAIRKARISLRNIEIGFLYRDEKVFINIYKQYVRCHLEYASQVWNPWTLNEIEKLEQVQKRAVNMVQGLKDLDYHEKLKRLKLEPLAIRRKKADLVLTYKILNGFCDVEKNTWFSTMGQNSLQTTRTSAYPLNLKKDRSKLELRKNFFSNRIVDDWNNLPIEIKDSRTVKEFKHKISELSYPWL